MILCDKIKFKKNETVYVSRFLSDGTATMASVFTKAVLKEFAIQTGTVSGKK